MARKKAKTKKVKPAEDSTLKELALAYGRVNGVPARRLKWLLAFSELDLDNLSEGHLANLRWELVVFGLNKKPDQMKSRSDIFHDLIALTVDLSPQGSLDTREEIEPTTAIRKSR